MREMLHLISAALLLSFMVSTSVAQSSFQRLSALPAAPLDSATPPLLPQPAQSSSSHVSARTFSNMLKMGRFITLSETSHIKDALDDPTKPLVGFRLQSVLFGTEYFSLGPRSKDETMGARHYLTHSTSDEDSWGIFTVTDQDEFFGTIKLKGKYYGVKKLDGSIVSSIHEISDADRCQLVKGSCSSNFSERRHQQIVELSVRGVERIGAPKVGEIVSLVGGDLGVINNDQEFIEYTKNIVQFFGGAKGNEYMPLAHPLPNKYIGYEVIEGIPEGIASVKIDTGKNGKITDVTASFAPAASFDLPMVLNSGEEALSQLESTELLQELVGAGNIKLLKSPKLIWLYSNGGKPTPLWRLRIQDGKNPRRIFGVKVDATTGEVSVWSHARHAAGGKTDSVPN